MKNNFFTRKFMKGMVIFMKRRLLTTSIICLLLIAITYYVLLPAINIHSMEMWMFVIVHLIIFIVLNQMWIVTFHQPKSKVMTNLVGIIVILVILLVIGNVIGFKIFRANTYATQIAIEDGDFEKDFVEEENISNIALMDTDSAIILGNRTLGTLSDLVSQFEVSSNYTQINYNGSPMKVSPLNYGGIIKYFKNDGIPGYVLVDPVNNTAQFIRLEDKIQYSHSSYFSKDLNRKLRFDYPTLLFSVKHFEIDDDGNPYWICPVEETNAALFGAKNVTSVVVLDAISGESSLYDIEEIPSWVDYVYSGEKITELYNWYGKYKNGFWNSIFGQEGCTSTTGDYGYKTIGDALYIFTGITSLTTEDESNIGFIMVNARTGAFKYYAVSGAEEYSAMSAAEGEVQQYDYQASFPSVINVNGEPTYLMVLKDDNSIVKLYAMVNLENYNIVATGNTQQETLTEYKKLLAKSTPAKDLAEDEIITSTITISQINFVVVDGETICYIKDTNKNCYKLPFQEYLITLEAGSVVTVKYATLEKITELISIE